MIHCRVLTALSDLQDIEIVADEVWGAGQGVPLNLMRAIAAHAGVVIGAYDDDDPIGVALAFMAAHPKTLWSHMAGVRPEYQGRGVGSLLKWTQRAWALAHDCDEIHWTFDPLQRGNAHFNLHLLGASAGDYQVNFYGTMNDNINGALPSDRVVAVWKLDDPVVMALATNHDPRSLPTFTPNALILGIDDDGMPRPLPRPLPRPDGTLLFAQIPPNLAALRQTNPDAALAWRMAQRQTLKTAFEAGWRAVDFLSTNDIHAYVLIYP